MTPCGTMRPWRNNVLECDRKADHRGKHRAMWREGDGDRWVDVIVWWKR